ncbi:response regulator [Sulfurimonas aquatica]|uniref:Response regulator n=1 Tax=Sulfurimonas aquatica TaxID=2672570 RepID=A0A975GC81_9BACT|nr:response regulator [Sulfurimonas aquatica]QSZ41345.1 response regulator [Sulfurimonas aquatica]
MNKNKIIIVEDDEITSLNLNMSLQKYGYSVVGACDNIEQAENKILTHTPDIVIIDISLQESDDGIILANIIRQKYDIPFIYLTSYSDDEVIEKAKETEPYGYIVKPFDPNSLHATIQMALFKYDMENNRKNSIVLSHNSIGDMLKNQKTGDEEIIKFGDGYHIFVSGFEIFYKGKKIKLTKKENAFLRLLVAKLDEVITFEQAVTYVWQNGDATQNSLRTLVWRLRNKLATDIIKSASGVGYYIEK